MSKEKISVWETLTTDEMKLEVDQHRQKKGNLDYLSWAWAWGKLKDKFPEATFEKYWFDNGSSHVPYTTDGKGHAYVQVTVTVEGSSLTEILPVLDNKNKPVTNPDSFQVNTALQRCLCKAIAYHGLGFHIYAGEDLEDYTPEVLPEKKKDEKVKKPTGKEIVDEPLVKEVLETFDVDTITQGANVYNDSGSLLKGFDETDCLLVFSEETPIKDKIVYLSENIDSILKDSLTSKQLINKFLQSNSSLFNDMAKYKNINIKESKMWAKIAQHTSTLKG